MTRTSMYDRISERRAAAEALTQEEEKRAHLAAELAAKQVQNPPPIAMRLTASQLSLGGFTIQFPTDLHFYNIETTLERNGHPVRMNVQRRDVLANEELQDSFNKALDSLAAERAALKLIRRRDCLLAGNPAQIVDFHFNADHREMHGRLIGAIVPVDGCATHQWLAISTVVDPGLPGLGCWLIEFDILLTGLTTA